MRGGFEDIHEREPVHREPGPSIQHDNRVCICLLHLLEEISKEDPNVIRLLERLVTVVSEDEPPRGSLQGSVLTDIGPNGKVEARVQELLAFWPDGSSHEHNLGWSLRWSFIT